jgi:curved DNA-binding protein
MAIAFKDYYKVLGLTPDASQDDIRAAFRKLARLYHPDLAPGSEDKFKEVQEAYEVLGQPSRRRKYDYLGRFDRYSGFDGPQEEDFDDDDDDEPNEEWSELTRERFSDFFREFFKDEKSADPDADPIEEEVAVTLEEAATGSVRSISLKRSVHCHLCFGVGRVNQQLCVTCKGHGSIERTENCRVKIPAGVRPGKVLRIPGMGQKVGLDGSAADLLLRVRFTHHPEFDRDGDDLYCSLALAPWEAVLGSHISVPTLTGRVNVQVPPGAQHGGKLRLKGRGLPRTDGHVGDLIVELSIKLPAELAARERAVLEHLRDISGFNPRAENGSEPREPNSPSPASN